MIGVFDSGLGGLTVLKSLREKLPNESFIYIGDTARLPYGVKSHNTIKKYLTQNIHFLLAQKVKAIVVACNTASSVIEVGEEYPVPVFEVISSSAQKAVEASMDEKIGVIATRTTVTQKSYVKHIQTLNHGVSVYQQACPMFVPLVEEGWIDDPITNLIVYRYLSPLMAAGVDTLILGCTHYPALMEPIRKVVGSGVQIVSSADSVGDRLAAEIEKGNIPAETNTPQMKFMTTDINPHFEEVSKKLFSPYPIDKFQVVHIN